MKGWRIPTVVSVCLVSLISLYSEEQALKKFTAVHEGIVSTSGPLVSFIIPSRLDRPTINATLLSLINQTVLNWEAIIGVDVHMSRYKSSEEIARKSKEYVQDPRLKFVPILTSTKDRGLSKNGSGDVRNEIIQNHTSSDWAAFVDDDDTLNPYYVDHLYDGIRGDERADIFIFHMLCGTSLIPRRELGIMAVRNNVGISFAVRTDVFTRENIQSRVLFYPDHTEDFNYLLEAQRKNLTIKMAHAVMYYVRQLPLNDKPESHNCSFEDAIVSEDFSRERVLFNIPWVQIAEGALCPWGSQNSSWTVPQEWNLTAEGALTMATKVNISVGGIGEGAGAVGGGGGK